MTYWWTVVRVLTVLLTIGAFVSPLCGACYVRIYVYIMFIVPRFENAQIVMVTLFNTMIVTFMLDYLVVG